MDEINSASRKISDITLLIEKIAFQINILALNAAVEAARGDQGSNFAVLVSEVRSLAQSTASSIKEINDLLLESVEKISKGTSDVKKSEEILQEINQKIISFAYIMDKISTASIEQQNGVEQVIEMSSITPQSASLVENIVSSSDELLSKASELVSLTSYFKVRDVM
jgi:methyl-accepting chemotaxis protein